MALPLVVWGLLLGGSVQAAESAGIQLYERGSYARAVRALSEEINNPAAPEAKRALARVYLAASFLALRKDVQAREQLEKLAQTYPAQRVDPAIFLPELVELDKAVRQDLEAARLREEAQKAERERLAAEATKAAERERLAAEATKAAERERLAAEATKAAERERPAAEATKAAEREPHPVTTPGSALRLRPEFIGYANMLGTRSVGYGVGLSVGYKSAEISLHLLPGSERHLGLRAELGYLFGRGPFQPRVALRGTHIRYAGNGLGGALGLRWTPVPRLTVLGDVGFESFGVDPARYESLVLPVSVGLGINLL